MEYVFEHICKDEPRQGYLFSRYVPDDKELKAECPGCGGEARCISPLNSRGRVRPNLTVIQDIEPYKSPLDGSIVGSRSRHRDHMREHGVIEMGNEYPKERKPTDISERAGYDIVRSLEQAGR